MLTHQDNFTFTLFPSILIANRVHVCRRTNLLHPKWHKRKIISVINYAHDMETYMAMGMEFQAFLKTVLRLDIPTPNKAPRHPLQRRLGGSQSRSKYGDEESDTYRQTFNSKDHRQRVQCALYCCSHLRLTYCHAQMLYHLILIFVTQRT